MTIAFILGAGFSKGYNPEIVPLSNNFMDVAEKNGILRPDYEHKELIDFIKKYFGEDYRKVNIETLATFLTTDLVPDVSQKYEYREKLYRQLHLIIIHTLAGLYDKSKDERTREIYQSFAHKLVEDEVNVITFNYDLILDNLLRKTGKWSQLSGYGIDMKVVDENNQIERLEEGRKIESKMSYLKLHGSLNWGKCILPHPYGSNEILLNPSGISKNEVISPIENFISIRLLKPIKSPLEYFDGTSVNLFYEPFIIPPIITKQDLYTIPLLQNIWYAARQVISKADEIYILGYSFPPSDFTVEFLFRQALASSFSISNKKINIINLEKCDIYKERVKNIFHYEPKCFEKDVVSFLETYVKNDGDINL